jgi:hypothetical protein
MVRRQPEIFCRSFDHADVALRRGCSRTAPEVASEPQHIVAVGAEPGGAGVLRALDAAVDLGEQPGHRLGSGLPVGLGDPGELAQVVGV